jgi:hypothetical protein
MAVSGSCRGAADANEGTRRGIVGNTDVSLLVRHASPGEVSTRAFVSGCKNGTRWRYTATATYGDGAMGWGAGGLTCRRHVVRIPKATGSAEGFSQDRPSGVRFVARGSDGDVRRVSYSTSTPDPVD